MQFEHGHIYHVYNRGNNQQTIFFNSENYLFFLSNLYQKEIIHNGYTIQGHWNNYSFVCFQYIHQNPMNAGLVKKMEDWSYSSFKDYAGLRNGTICNKELAEEIINFDKENFYVQSSISIDEQKLRQIW